MPEQFENNYITQLDGPIGASDVTLIVNTPPLTLTGGFRIRIDDEIIIVGGVAGSSFTGLTRGAESTTAASHADNATVSHVLTAGAIGARLTEIENLTKYAGIDAVIDGGGAVLTAGVKGYIEVPFNCTITSVRMFADVSGSIVIDIWKDSYANFPPTDADSITASATPTISSGTKSQDTTLSGWTTALSAGDILAYNVDSATNIKLVTVSLRVTRI